jgi:hypothetical protein
MVSETVLECQSKIQQMHIAHGGIVVVQEGPCTNSRISGGQNANSKLEIHMSRQGAL